MTTVGVNLMCDPIWPQLADHWTMQAERSLSLGNCMPSETLVLSIKPLVIIVPEVVHHLQPHQLSEVCHPGCCSEPSGPAVAPEVGLYP